MQSVLGAYRRVLANRALTRLLLGEFVSSVGDWLYLVALLIIIYQDTGDAVLLGVVGAARILPYVFLSVPAGILADRIDRRMILLVTDVARGLCVELLPERRRPDQVDELPLLFPMMSESETRPRARACSRS